MKPALHATSPRRRRGAARVIRETPPGAGDDGNGVLEHPDGWYWMAPDGHQQFGPFDSAELARADRARGSMETVVDDSAVREAEIVSGIAESADVETSRPRDEDESAEP